MKTRVPLHGVLGRTPGGTVAYSNQDWRVWTEEPAMSGHFMTGYKWQCVEFARRWLWEHKALLLPNVSIATHLFHAGHAYDPVQRAMIPARIVRNGGTEAPTADSVIVYEKDRENQFGHVGIIVEATDSYIRVADQNRYFHSWGDKGWSREFRVFVQPGRKPGEPSRYYIEDHSATPLGWLTFPDHPNLPLPQQHTTHISRRPFPDHISVAPSFRLR